MRLTIILTLTFCISILAGADSPAPIPAPAPKLTDAQVRDYWRAVAIYQTKKLDTIQAEQNLNKEYEKIKKLCGGEMAEDASGPQCVTPTPTPAPVKKEDKK